MRPDAATPKAEKRITSNEAKVDSGSDETSGQQKTHGDGQLRQPFQKPIALVVDDERMCITVARRILTRLGYAVAAASSGEEALEILRDADRSGTITADRQCVELTPLSPLQVIVMDIQVSFPRYVKGRY